MPVQDQFNGEAYAPTFRKIDALLDSAPTTTYRKLRDMWLKAEFHREESAALKSPWKEFCLSSLAWGAGRDLDALQLLHRGSRFSGRHFWMRYSIAEILLRRLNLYDLALAEIEVVIMKCPWLWEARCLRSENLIAVGHPDPLEALRALTVPEPSHASFLAWRGALELWSGEYEPAVKDLDISAGLDNPDALCWRGGALCKLGRLAESKRDLDRLLILDPKDPEGLVWRGEVNRLLGRLPEALKDLEDVIAISGDKPWAHVNRALIRLEQGDLDEAYKDFARLYLYHRDIAAIKKSPLTAAHLTEMLNAVLKTGRGCRRSDPHLNAGWMMAAGIPVPLRPAPDFRLRCWVGAMMIPVPLDDLAGTFTESQVLAAFAPPKAKKATAKRPSESAAIEEGRALFNARRFAEACVRFEAALVRNPRSAEAAVSLAHSLRSSADALLLQGRVAESLVAYERARELAPKDSGVLLSLARLYLRLNEAGKAEALLRRAVALKMGSEPSLLLGELLKGKDEAESRMHLKRAASGKPRTGDAHALLANGLTRFQANVKLGAFKEAFAEAEALLAALGSQDCIDAFFVSPDQKELMPTLEALKAFSVKQPGNPWPYYFRATLLSNMGRGEEAILETGRLQKMPKRYDWMRHKHGELLLANRRDYPGAEAEFAAALKCVPGFWKARAALAEIALCRGAATQAASHVDLLIEEVPNRQRAWGHAYRGKILLWSGMYKKALDSLEIGVSSGIPHSLGHRGAVRLLSGRLDEASADLEDALRLSVDVEGLTWRGELRRLRNDHKGAIDDLTAAIRMDGSNSFWALANRALARGACGDAAGKWSDFAMIRRDVLDRFEKEAGTSVKSAADSDAIRAVLEAGLKLGRGMRLANEYLFPVWMGDGRQS